jgi:uncharacterized protein
MLVNFSISNFLSFKDKQTLNLISDSLKDYEENLHIPYFYDSNEKLLKSVAIYGHNSSGKTNFIKGFRFFQQLIFKSFSEGQLKDSIDVAPFLLNTSMKEKSSSFEITFLIKETKYRYRFSITSKEVLEEELYYSQVKIKENYLFKRKGNDILISNIWNKESNNKVEKVKLFCESHILFLSALFSQKEIPRIDLISNWLGGNLVVPDNYLQEIAKAKMIYSDETYNNLILKFIRAADLGFKSIFDKIENKANSHLKLEKGILNMWYDKQIQDFELYTGHNVLNDEKTVVDTIQFELQKNESTGAIKYFIITSLLAYAIKNSQLIWIDELDARLDARLLEGLIQSFHNPNINPINSQLIFSTHNTILLDKKLRRDQMVIIEKNQYDESILRRIHSSKKPIRAGKSIEKEYRQGNTESIPLNLFDPDLFL